MHHVMHAHARADLVATQRAVKSLPAHRASRCAHTATSRAGRLAGWRCDVCWERAGSRTVFRLPPPIPGKPGGGYPQEWHSAQTTIKRNYVAHMERKRARAPVMQEVILCVRGGKPPRPPARWRCLRVLIACSFQQIRRLSTAWQRAWPCCAGTSNRRAFIDFL